MKVKKKQLTVIKKLGTLITFVFLSFMVMHPLVAIARESDGCRENIDESAFTDTCAELGAFFFSGHFPAYEGSRERKTWNIFLPYFLYEGPVLKVKKEEASILGFKSRHWTLSMSGMLTPGTSSEESDRRRSLPDLKAVMEAGPSLKWYPWGRDAHWLIDFPVRYAFSAETDSQGLGFIFNPKVSYHSSYKQKSLHFQQFSFDFSLGMKVVRSKYSDYFYGVEPSSGIAAQASDLLPYYEGRGGYGGSYISFAVNQKMHAWQLGSYVRFTSLSNTAFEESPLMEKKNSWFLGGYVSRPLWVWRKKAGMVKKGG